MKISEMVTKLNELKKDNGDLEVFIDLKSVIENGEHGEYTHEEEIELKVDKILIYDADKGRMIPNSERPVLSIGTDF